MKAWNDNKLVMLFLYLLYGFFTGIYVGGIIFPLKQFFSGLMMFSSIIAFNYYSAENNYGRLKTILILFLVIWFYYMVSALRFYSENVGAARILASIQDAYGNIAIGGGYTLAYGTAILVTVMLNLLLDNRLKTIPIKVLVTVFMIVGMFVVVSTESTVTLIALAIGIIATIFFRRKDDFSSNTSISNRVIKAIIVIFIGAITLLFISKIGEIVIELSYSFEGILGDRLRSFGYAMSGDKTAGSYALGRASIFTKSFNTFINNPIFGVSYMHGNGFLNMGVFGVGNHCEWIDAFANYGLIIGLLFISIYIKQFKEVSRSNNKLSFGWGICLLSMGLFNPFRSFQSNAAVFFLIPAIASIDCFSLINKWEDG